MAVKKKLKKPESIIPQAKLLRLFQIISLLKTGRWSIKGIAQRFDASDRTIYRYIKLLETVDFPVEKGFDNLYFIQSSEDEPTKSAFTIEEMKLIKKLIQTEVENNPLKGLLLKKLSLNSEMDQVPRIIVKARLGKLVDQLAQCIRNKKQAVLKDYHSANSNEIKDRLIEPIEFGDNYQTIMALDTKDKECKQFKLDRIGDVIEMNKEYKFEQLHKRSTADIFGMTGKTSIWITLQLKMRAYLLLREDHPLSIPYFEKGEDGQYLFHGPVNNFDGIARFVLGLLDEVKVIQPTEFKNYIKAKIDSKTIV
ncbi:MAG: WYL domain-containing protein [Cyclobacteriaceae bacterium]|nr:WYL domain-containing protein [Cyclobacteriaceae bacterium]MBX2961959.1 WYL domain-containing protein [Cyclobacteriaceae bacterium]